MNRAARLFAERGYDPTSVADIVESLGVGKGVFYWYFTSKEELLAEILKASSHDLRRRQQAAIGSEADPLERIAIGVRTTLLWFRDHRDYFSIIQFAATDERFAPVLRRNRETALGDTIRHLKDAIIAGRIPDQDAELLALAVLGVVQQLARRYLIDGDEPVDRVSEAAVAFCLHGLVG